MKKSYVLFIPGAAGPTVIHETIEDARHEARRLLDLRAGSKVMICEYIEGLEAITSTKKLKKCPLITHGDVDEQVPF